MPKKGENIYKRKDGRWEGRFIKEQSVTGKTLYGYVYASSYQEVRQKRQDAIQKYRLSVVSSREKEPDFRDFAEEWFRHIKPLTKESTYIKYRNLWNSYIQPELGAFKLSELTQLLMEAYCKNLITRGGHKREGLSPKTVSDTISLIRIIFRFCNSRNVKVPCDIQWITIKQEIKEMRVFSLEEQQILCSYIYSNLCIRNVGILLSLFTGIRVGELCALRWEDISFSEKTIHVHQTMQRIQVDQEDRCEGKARTKIIVTTPKSRSSVRTIPLPEQLALLMQNVQNSSSGYFLTGCDTKWVEPRTMQNCFKRLLKICEIKDANYHALRHTFATRCIEIGFDVKSLSEILGHASVNITMNRYVHPSMQLKRDNMQRLSRLLTETF